MLTKLGSVCDKMLCAVRECYQMCKGTHTPISTYLESTGVPRALHRSKEYFGQRERDKIIIG